MCNNLNLCSCFVGYTGSDCSEEFNSSCITCNSDNKGIVIIHTVDIQKELKIKFK